MWYILTMNKGMEKPNAVYAWISSNEFSNEDKKTEFFITTNFK